MSQFGSQVIFVSSANFVGTSVSYRQISIFNRTLTIEYNIFFRLNFIFIFMWAS